MSIPVNLITGFLGVGKTTAVMDLLRHKTPGSRWAVLVNEYGEVGIDAALIEGSGPAGITVEEVAGGCICCATAPYLHVALHFLLLDAKPDRLIIETSGLGHPARLLDMLRNNYRDRLEVHATLALVDPADFARPEMRMNRVFRDQIDLADVLVMNKLDLAEPTLVAEFQRWANELDPPKLLIVGTTHGQLDPAWLDLTPSDSRQTMTRPHDNSSGNVLARGWVFAPNIVFDRERLLTVLHGMPDVSRLKGIFHVGDDWIAVNRTSSGLTCEPTAYRRDSRIDVFAENLDWTAFGKQLETCILARH